MKTQTLGFLVVMVLLASLALGACGLMLKRAPRHQNCWAGNSHTWYCRGAANDNLRAVFADGHTFTPDFNHYG